MSDYSKLPPIAVSLGGFAFNGEHIEYWKTQATKADREIASLRAQLASARKSAIGECIAILNGHEWCKYADGTVSPMGAAARALRALTAE